MMLETKKGNDTDICIHTRARLLRLVSKWQMAQAFRDKLFSEAQQAHIFCSKYAAAAAGGQMR